VFTNGIDPGIFAGPEHGRAFTRHRDRTDDYAAAGEDVPHPSLMGYGMVLNARGNVYGDTGRVPAATVARRRARNKAARRARRAGRK
jgi:hypothetical protein